MQYWSCEDGRIYTEHSSLFTGRDSIWTFNCPCPSGEACHKKRHVCCFKPNNAGHQLDKNSRTAKKLAEEFQELVTLFTKQRALPSPAPVVSIRYSTYGDFRELRDKLALKMRHKLCRHSTSCFTENCVFAHSVYEMIEVFDDERVRHFYKNVAKIRSKAYKPVSYRIQDEDRIYCSATSECRAERMLIQIQLYDQSSEELLYPYCVVRCNTCKRVANIGVYK